MPTLKSSTMWNYIVVEIWSMDCKTKVQLFQYFLAIDFISCYYNVASSLSNTNHTFHSFVYFHIGDVVDSIGWSIGIYVPKSQFVWQFQLITLFYFPRLYKPWTLYSTQWIVKILVSLAHALLFNY